MKNNRLDYINNGFAMPLGGREAPCLVLHDQPADLAGHRGTGLAGESEESRVERNLYGLGADGLLRSGLLIPLGSRDQFAMGLGIPAVVFGEDWEGDDDMVDDDDEDDDEEDEDDDFFPDDTDDFDDDDDELEDEELDD